MNSNPQYKYNNPIYFEEIIHPINYENENSHSKKGERLNLSSQNNYPSNLAFEHYEKTN